MATALKNIAGFQQTKEMAHVTLSGWDGKSYDGEGRNLRVWTNPMHPGKKFVRVNFRGGIPAYTATCFHLITDEKHEKSGVTKAEFYTDVD